MLWYARGRLMRAGGEAQDKCWAAGIIVASIDSVVRYLVNLSCVFSSKASEMFIYYFRK